MRPGWALLHLHADGADPPYPLGITPGAAARGVAAACNPARFNWAPMSACEDEYE